MMCVQKSKSHYKQNKNVMIVNAVLFLIPYLGMLFMIVLGLFQVIISIIIASKFNTLALKAKQLFVTYIIVIFIYITLVFTTDYIHSSMILFSF